MMHKIILLSSFLSLLVLTACNGNLLKGETARRLAHPAWMVERQIPTIPFSITAYERMHERHAPANIYIEGDGFNRIIPYRGAHPTSGNPVALHLASKDKAKNLVYLARPCQYSGNVNKTPCDPTYYQEGRYSQTVINAYHQALDEIKTRYNIENFNLIGFSGGAAIATILSAQRQDVTSLRTVAGKLDHVVYTTLHNTTPLTDSLNPVDFADQLRNIPQIHYAGRHDTIIPPAITESYLQKLNPSNCITYTIIENAAHIDGWVNQWPELLEEKPVCTIPPGKKTHIIYKKRPKPVYRPREPDLEKSSSWTK